jgi:uncharacterized protein YdhG (YjbR/CyaY superfamily)
MTKATTIDEFLATVADERQRAALEKLRKTIKAAAPKAEECINYGIPGFRLQGRYLVGFTAAKKHCSFFPGTALQGFDVELKDFDTSKGTIRFQPEEPLPAALVKRIVKARIAQHAAQK